MGDAQAEATAFNIIFKGEMAAVKRFEKMSQFFGGNGVAAVPNGEGREGTGFLKREFDPALGVVMFDGIFAQVQRLWDAGLTK